MTVKELIEELEKMPLDAEVETYGSCGFGEYGGSVDDVHYDGENVIIKGS